MMDLQETTRDANAGDVKAQLRLAHIAYSGEGGEQDLDVARQWYRLAAQNGSGLAFHVLGVMAQEGQGEDRDPNRALQYYLRGAELGSSSAALNAGVLYEVGLGVERDPQSALSWYRKGMEGNNPRAAHNFGALKYALAASPAEYGEALAAFSKAYTLGFEKSGSFIRDCLDALGISEHIERLYPLADAASNASTQQSRRSSTR